MSEMERRSFLYFKRPMTEKKINFQFGTFYIELDISKYHCTVSLDQVPAHQSPWCMVFYVQPFTFQEAKFDYVTCIWQNWRNWQKQCKLIFFSLIFSNMCESTTQNTCHHIVDQIFDIIPTLSSKKYNFSNPF